MQHWSALSHLLVGHPAPQELWCGPSYLPAPTTSRAVESKETSDVNKPPWVRSAHAREPFKLLKLPFKSLGGRST